MYINGKFGNMQRISIITVNYNNKVGLEKTILSIINQDYQNKEYLVIDGGSTDGSVSIIEKYKDYINYWVSESDKGVYHAMNKGIQKASGEYLNFMNSGDCFYASTTLSEIFKEEQMADILYGDLFRINDGKILSKKKHDKDASLLTLYHQVINHQSIFSKRELHEKFPFNEELKIIADWDFLIRRMLSGAVFKHTNTVVCLFDVTGVSHKEIKPNDINNQQYNAIWNELVQLPIRKDYETLHSISQIDLSGIISFLSHTGKYNKMIAFFVKVLYYIGQFLRKFK